MGDAAAHVNFEQSAIERKRLIEFGKALIDFASEASAPKFRVRALAHSFLAASDRRARSSSDFAGGLTSSLTELHNQRYSMQICALNATIVH